MEEGNLADESNRTTSGGSDDEAILQGLQRKDPQAMELLYNRLSGRAFGLAYRILGDGPSAEDALQDAFLTLWRNAYRLDRRRGSLTSFLLTIVHHKAVDLLRSRRGQAARSLPLDSLSADDPNASELLERATSSLGREALWQALNSLPQEQREAMELAYFEGLTHVEIAESLKIPLGTVKSRLRLGLEKMRAALEMEPRHGL